MPMELDMIGLTAKQRSACAQTMSANTFYMLVADALVSARALSLVRMGDGEKYLYLHCKDRDPDQTVKPPNAPFSEAWHRGLGCYDIPNGEMIRRLKLAAETCDYFAPNIMGIQRDEFDVGSLFWQRREYVDNWCVREWSRKLQDNLLKQAGHVLFIHADWETRTVFADRLGRLGVQSTGIEMSSWEHADGVMAAANHSIAQLVLFAGGPAGKHIAPLIATGGSRPKVVLDLGHAFAENWL
jgi:hypothetical protein